MLQNIVKNKAVKIALICVTILLICAIIATLAYKSIKYYVVTLPEIHEMELRQEEIKTSLGVGVPGEYATRALYDLGRTNINLFFSHFTGTEYEDYRLKTSDKLTIMGDKVRINYTGKAKFYDSEIMTFFKTSSPIEMKYGTISSGAVNENNELRYLKYSVPESKYYNDQNTPSQIFNEVAESILGDLEGYRYTETRRMRPWEWAADKYELYLTYAKYSGEIMLEDYMDVYVYNFKRGVYVYIYVNTDARNEEPLSDPDAVWEYVKTRVYSEVMGDETENETYCSEPFRVRLHRDPQGLLYVRGYVWVDYHPNSGNNSGKNYLEFILYLPEEFQS